jgi:hypothetical protein
LFGERKGNICSFWIDKMQFKRKLYRRGSSFETTVPMPMLFSLDLNKKNDIIFTYDKKTNRWFVDFQERKSKEKK